jgi:hypothetical protein
MSGDDTEDREIVRKHTHPVADGGSKYREPSHPDADRSEVPHDYEGPTTLERVTKPTAFGNVTELVEVPDRGAEHPVQKGNGMEPVGGGFDPSTLDVGPDFEGVAKDTDDSDGMVEQVAAEAWDGRADLKESLEDLDPVDDVDWEAELSDQQASEKEVLLEIRDELQGMEQPAEQDDEAVAKAVEEGGEDDVAGDGPDSAGERLLKQLDDLSAMLEARMNGEQKGLGPFQDHAECVAHFEDVDGVDDPEAACDLVAANPDLDDQYDVEDGGIAAFLEELENPDAKSVLRDLEVTHVSGVADPAQDSQWILAKDADAKGADWGVSAPLVVKAEDGDREQQKAWAPVLIPNETDKQGDVIPADEIEKAAHEFLSEFRNIDTDHDLLSGKGSPIESWTLKTESTFTRPDGGESREYPAGTWMLGVKFADEAWQRVKSGDLTGFSIYGEAEEVPTEAFQADPEGVAA